MFPRQATGVIDECKCSGHLGKVGHSGVLRQKRQTRRVRMSLIVTAGFCHGHGNGLSITRQDFNSDKKTPSFILNVR